MSSTVYEIVTQNIITQLEQGHIPWKRPWKPSDTPINVRGTRYSGVNVFLLLSVMERRGYKSRKWLTYKQAQEMGGTIRKGEHGTQIIFSNAFVVRGKDTDGKEFSEKKFSLRYYTIFNTEQTEGIIYKPDDILAEIGPTMNVCQIECKCLFVNRL